MSVRTFLSSSIALLLLLTAGGCIKNDIPYPRIQQDILSIAAEGQKGAAAIDNSNLTADIVLAEDVDITNVKFTDFTYTEGGTASVNLLEGTYDLSSPLKVVLTRYQSYEWIVSASQPIERYFTISGQVGETAVDVVGRRVVVYVPTTADRSHLQLTGIKLGPANVTTMAPDLKAGDYIDASKPFHIAVTAFGRTEDWTVYVDVTDAKVTTTQVDAWVNVIWAYGTAQEGAANGFQYRKADSFLWTDVPADAVTHEGGTFRCCIPHLEPMTQYVVRAVSDEYFGNEVTVTTGASRVLPDGSFDQWWLDGKVWCPWDENGVKFWDTGNTGAATLGQSNVVPSDITPTGAGQSAKLETKFVGIAGIGKLAAGSIYSGDFVKVDGTNGILAFGREWSERPTKLRGYYQYTTAPINYTSSEWKDLMGRPDSCHIYVALVDYNEPYEVRTNPKNRKLFDRNAPEVIAYGELISGDNTGGYRPFEITLNYRSTSRVPRYLIIVSAASKYGDFFTGGTGATLYVDQYSLDYDY